jgi:hypothetical protein
LTGERPASPTPVAARRAVWFAVVGLLLPVLVIPVVLMLGQVTGWNGRGLTGVVAVGAAFAVCALVALPLQIAALVLGIRNRGTRAGQAAIVLVAIAWGFAGAAVFGL